MDTLVDYTNSVLDQYRSFTHDAILIYGFIPENALAGVIKARFIIENGLRLVETLATIRDRRTHRFWSVDPSLLHKSPSKIECNGPLDTQYNQF